MAKEMQHEFEVVGTGDFPIDMLRHDCCWPARSEDAIAISDSSYSRRRDASEVRVRLRHNGNRHWMPTFDRWKSFTWRVDEASVRSS